MNDETPKTLREKFLELIANDSQFQEAKPSGKAFQIVGARPAVADHETPHPRVART